jgi:uncharacterized protein YbdZ (MbtH family)
VGCPGPYLSGRPDSGILARSQVSGVRTASLLKETGISGHGTRKTEERKRHFLRKYEMRGELLRWRHRKEVPDGWRGVCVSEVKGSRAKQQWGQSTGSEAVSQSLRERAGAQAAGKVGGLLLTVPTPEEKALQPGRAHTCQAWARHLAWHCWSQCT